MLGQKMEKSIVIFISMNQIICKGHKTNFLLINVNAAIHLSKMNRFSLNLFSR